MKQAQCDVLRPISKEAREALTRQENETVATEFINNDQAFSNIDLWNIHRQREVKKISLNSSSLHSLSGHFHPRSTSPKNTKYNTMQQASSNSRLILTPKTKRFLKRSVLFAFLYASLLYALVRIFFYEFPFTVAEGLELHIRMWSVVWLFIAACKLICVAVIATEQQLANIQLKQVNYLEVIKNTIMIILSASLTYAIKAQGVNEQVTIDGPVTCQETMTTPGYAFQ